MQIQKTLALFMVLCLAFGSLIAADYQSTGEKIHDGLADRLANMKADETIKVVIMFHETVDTRALAAQHDTRHARNQAVVSSLKEKASIVQAGLLEELQILKDMGEVISFDSYWLGNQVCVETYPGNVVDLAEKSEVRLIFENFPIELIEPVHEAIPMESAPGAPESGLLETNIAPVWALGYDGTGTLVMNFDTGVSGNHPALNARWKGNTAPASESWIRTDQPGSTFPFDNNGHGTHTMGTITGLDANTADSIGMAPGATWISAGASLLISTIYQDALIAFQWAADPDGNSNTSDDVPVVCSNSWGSGTVFGEPPCNTGYDAMVQDLEAAGVAVIFAAGNEGPSSQSMRSPAEMIHTPLQVFSVGSMDPGGNNISSFSSRGPSPCPGTDDERIKPEVTARGSNVRSAYFSGYANLSGTSMACPHVAGAIAVLSQAFPNATGEDLKAALYNTAVDMGDAGPDNTYGNGKIDVYAAYLELLGGGTGADLDVSLDLSSNSGNGATTLEMTFDNTTGGSLNADVWCEVELPSGSTSLVFVKTRNWAAGVSTKNRNFTIPAGGATGNYTFTLYSGTYPSTIDDSDSETYNKTSLAAPAGNLAEAEVVPTSVMLDQNYPNPFNPSTNIRFGLDEDLPVTIKIYNSLGQQVKTLVSGVYAAGYHTVEWNGTNDAGQQVATGLYVYRMEAGDRIMSQKMFFSK